MAIKTSIQRVRPYGKDAYTYYPVVIIGAGESGISMGCRLKQVLGFDQFRIFDRQAGVGGTWWINRYPGVACDVPAMLYSFSFATPQSWTTLHPPGPEIVDYYASVCQDFGITDKIQVNTEVASLRWLEDEDEWELKLDHLVEGAGDLSADDRRQREAEKGSLVTKTELIRAKIVVSGCGSLVQPKPWPNVPGLETFKGELLHTARWKTDVDLKDKDVVVIGTGCTSTQLVPELIKPYIGAKSVTQLMRSPPWVSPVVLNPEELKWWEKWMPRLMNVPGLVTTIRAAMFFFLECDFQRHMKDNALCRAGRKRSAAVFMEYMRARVPEKYHEILTPDYEIFCKRRIVDGEWFGSLHDPSVTLTTKPLTAVGPDTVTIGPGRNYPPLDRTDSTAPVDEETIHADAIILANGYAVEEFLHPLSVKGKNGSDLHEVWKERGGAQAYLGTAMDGFPNFFLIYGPNMSTGHSSVVFTTECQVNYALKFIEPILKGHVTTWEVKEAAERRWTKMMQDGHKSSVFGFGGCSNWYSTADGWNSATYPYSQIDVWFRTCFPRWSDWQAKYTQKGIVHRRLRLSSFILLIAGFAWFQRSLARSGVSNATFFQRLASKGLGYVALSLQVLRSRLS